jgi:predicted dehydrogenase
MNRPRVAFLGTGWIGLSRMEAMIATGAIEAATIADPSPAMRDEALKLAPGARAFDSLEALLETRPDGVVIATPSAMHAEQAIRCLEAGAAVFCQKPLGRDAAEARAVVDAARAADRLLAVDLSYRWTAGMAAIRDLLARGELGRVHAIDLVFHNAYGPDKPWFYDLALAGGGCVMDLGVHLVDLALWSLGWPAVQHVDARLFAGGERLAPSPDRVEDYAVATLDLAGGAVVRLACSWKLPAGQDAIIEAQFFGEGAGAAFTNVDGSFMDFRAERFRGTAREPLAGADAAGTAAPPPTGPTAWPPARASMPKRSVSSRSRQSWTASTGVSRAPH